VIREVRDDQPDPEASCLQSGRTRCIREGMSALPNEQRLTIELAYFGGLTYTEIAAKLGLPLGTVKARIRLGLERLRMSLMAFAEDGL
jgi:RNA polymerase sigma-70 factor (ECF subfamily)